MSLLAENDELRYRIGVMAGEIEDLKTQLAAARNHVGSIVRGGGLSDLVDELDAERRARQAAESELATIAAEFNELAADRDSHRRVLEKALDERESLKNAMQAVIGQREHWMAEAKDMHCELTRALDAIRFIVDAVK